MLIFSPLFFISCKIWVVIRLTSLCTDIVFVLWSTKVRIISDFECSISELYISNFDALRRLTPTTLCWSILSSASGKEGREVYSFIGTRDLTILQFDNDLILNNTQEILNKIKEYCKIFPILFPPQAKRGSTSAA